MDVIGLEAVLRDANFRAGLARYQQGINSMIQANQKATTSAEALGRAMGGALVVGIGAAVAAFGALASIAGVGVKSLMSWGESVDTLNDLLGLGAENSSVFAFAMNKVGVGVDEGLAGFSAFVRGVSEFDQALGQAADAYAETMDSLARDHADAVGKIGAQMAEAQAEAAASISEVWSDLSSKQAEIASDLADTIAGIQANLAERLGELAYNYNRQLEDFAQDAVEIERDAAKQRRDIEEDYARQIQQIDRDLAEKIATTRSGPERRRLRAEAAARKKDLAEQKAERLRDMEEQRAERQADLAQRRADTEREYAHERALAEKSAAQQIAAAEKAAAKQMEAAEKAANAQVAAIEKALAKQQAALAANLAEQDKAYKEAQAKAAQTLGKAQEASPFAEALKKLGISLKDANGQVKDANTLLLEAAKAWDRLPDGPNKAAVALALFGRGGAKFLDLLHEIAVGFDADRKQASAFGLVLTQQNLEDIENFAFALNVMGLGVKGVFSQIGLAVLPLLAEIVNKINENMPAILGFVQQVITAFKTGDWSQVQATAGKAFSDIWVTIQPILQETWNNVLKMLGVLLTLIQNWVNAPETQATIQSIGTAIGAALFNGLQSLIQDPRIATNLVNSIATLLINVWNALLQTVNNIGANLATGIVNGIIKALTGAELTNAAKSNIENWMKGLFNLVAPSILSPSGGIPQKAGGGYIPRNTLAMLHAGEYVVPAAAVASMYSPRSVPIAGPTINNRSYANTIMPGAVTLNFPGGSSAAPHDIERVVYRTVKQVINQR